MTRLIPYGLAALCLYGCSSMASVHSENQLEVTVYLCDARGDGQVLRQPSEVVLRDRQGRIVFRGSSDKNGEITMPIDYRSLDSGYQIEARMDLGLGEYIGGLITPTGRSKRCSVFIPTPVALSDRRAEGGSK